MQKKQRNKEKKKLNNEIEIGKKTHIKRWRNKQTRKKE